jgi:hypothetical protein
MISRARLMARRKTAGGGAFSPRDGQVFVCLADLDFLQCHRTMPVARTECARWRTCSIARVSDEALTQAICKSKSGVPIQKSASRTSGKK